MARKKKEVIEAEIVEFEKLDNKEKKSEKIFNISDGFYYLIGIIFGIILIFATEEFLSTVNYLFVVIFAVISVIKIIYFILAKDYERKVFSNMVIGIMSAWVAIFIFKYGQFLFLELLPVMVSLLLVVMATSSIIKYLTFKKKMNLIISIISMLLGLLLIFLPESILYTCFKITGFYLLITMILDLIDNKTKTSK